MKIIEGLPGVNIIVKGTSTGSITDFNGGYQVSVPEQGSTLIFSAIGYNIQEVVIVLDQLLMYQ